MTTTNTQSTTETLEPCPNPECQSIKATASNDFANYYVYCPDCFLRGPRESADNFGSRWNALPRISPASAASVVDEAPLDNEAVDKELRRWQDAIRDKLIDLGAPDWKIDGAGCDSGDPLDFTLAEVGQGCGWFIDQIEELKTTPKVMGQLRAALQSDPDYAWGWHCNIAMAAFDEGLDREAANRAAARFLKNCFGIDTEQRSKTDEWPDVIKEF